MASPSGSTRGPRVAASDDLETVTTIITLAFAEDPVWGPAFARGRGRPDGHELWRSYLAALLRYPWTWLTAREEATSVWLPPGEDEMTDEQWQAFVALMRRHLGADTDRVVALFERFEGNHPHHELHYYLSLLGTHPDQRGAGHGMRLLADNLARIDDDGIAAYLESTNPANDARYQRVGFEVVGSFEGYLPGSVITSMWRPARR
jgi:ribosomal protein S18 acetylase RimI-like enzyme